MKTMSIQKTELITPHGTIHLPAFLPDGTQGVVKSLAGPDVLASGVQALQMNVYHLMQRPGSSTIQSLGGLHQMSAWHNPIFTDSGGFQVYSLIRQNPKSGSITNKGATFRLEGSNKKFNFTPEKSIQLQLSYGADVVICLDDCTAPDDPHAVQEEAVTRTILWAQRCRNEFDKLTEGWEKRPLLVAPIQGGISPELRRRCANALLDIGFDGYGYGGWPLDKNNNLLIEMLGLVRELIPPEFTVHALGVGHPQGIVDCVALGYNLFDSTMPTRDARHGRLYTFTQYPNLAGQNWFKYLYIKDKKHIKTNLPLEETCDCFTCTHFTIGYVHHLYMTHDPLYPRLATMHNLRFITRLMALLRDKNQHG